MSYEIIMIYHVKLLWYHNNKNIETFAKKLEKLGYQTVEIRKTEDDNFYLLHMEEYAIHSPESLFKNCHTLAKLANESNIEVFDGWDTATISMSEGLIN